MASQMSIECKAAVLGLLGAAGSAVCSWVHYRQNQEVQMKKLVKAAETAAQKATYLERTASAYSVQAECASRVCLYMA